MTLGLALRYSCFCDNGTELARSDALRLLSALWTDGIRCGLSCMGVLWLQWTLRALMMWVIYLWPHSRYMAFTRVGIHHFCTRTWPTSPAVGCSIVSMAYLQSRP